MRTARRPIRRTRQSRRKSGGASDPPPNLLQTEASKQVNPKTLAAQRVHDFTPQELARNWFYVALSAITYLSPQPYAFLLPQITAAYDNALVKINKEPKKAAQQQLVKDLVKELTLRSNITRFTEWRRNNHTEIVFNPLKRMFYSLTKSQKKRTMFAPLSHMNVELTEEGAKLPIQVPVGPHNESFAFFHDPATDSNGYLSWTESKLGLNSAASGENKLDIKVSFRGSSSAKNWIQNAKSLIKKDEAIELNGSWELEGTFPGGFLNSLNPILYPIADVLARVLNGAPNASASLAITGHSLGGAMASLMYLILMTSKTPDIAAIRFRLGNGMNIKLYAISPAPVLPRNQFGAFISLHSKGSEAEKALAAKIAKGIVIVMARGDPVPYLNLSIAPGFGGVSLNDILLPAEDDIKAGSRLRPIKAHTNIEGLNTFFDNVLKAKSIEALSEKASEHDHPKSCKGTFVATVVQIATPFKSGQTAGDTKVTKTGAKVKLTEMVDRIFESDRTTTAAATKAASKDLGVSALSPLFRKLNSEAFMRFITGKCKVKTSNGCPPVAAEINDACAVETTPKQATKPKQQTPPPRSQLKPITPAQEVRSGGGKYTRKRRHRGRRPRPRPRTRHRIRTHRPN